MIGKEKKMDEHFAKHHKYMVYTPLIVGALILINSYLIRLSWITFIGWVLVLTGLCKIIMHKTCCNSKKK